MGKSSSGPATSGATRPSQGRLELLRDRPVAAGAAADGHQAAAARLDRGRRTASRLMDHVDEYLAVPEPPSRGGD